MDYKDISWSFHFDDFLIDWLWQYPSTTQQIQGVRSLSHLFSHPPITYGYYSRVRKAQVRAEWIPQRLRSNCVCVCARFCTGLGITWNRCSQWVCVVGDISNTLLFQAYFLWSPRESDRSLVEATITWPPTREGKVDSHICCSSGEKVEVSNNQKTRQGKQVSQYLLRTRPWDMSH